MQKWEKVHITNRLRVAKVVGIMHMESRTDVGLLNLPWWLPASLSAITLKVWEIFTGENMYYVHLQLWFIYVLECYNTFCLLLMTFTAARCIYVWQTSPKVMHVVTPLTLTHCDVTICLGRVFWHLFPPLISPSVTSSACHSKLTQWARYAGLEGCVSWNPGTVHITYSSGKQKLAVAIGCHHHNYQERFCLSMLLAQSSSCQDVWRQPRALESQLWCWWGAIV